MPAQPAVLRRKPQRLAQSINRLIAHSHHSEPGSPAGESPALATVAPSNIVSPGGAEPSISRLEFF